jgi:hypothetical protein
MMQAETSMTVDGEVPTLLPLVDQLEAVVGEDPLLLGAKGYLDDVYTERLTLGSPGSTQ